MISARHLRKMYGGKAAVDDVSFEVGKGETLALLGTSGCGKTTTLKMLNRLVTQDGGEVWIDGKKADEEDPQKLRMGMGYVLQDTGLFPHYTVGENIAIVPRLLGWNDVRCRRRIIELLDKLHLPQASAGQYPNELSGGQQQRVGIARALAAAPPVLLMDEPFGALDPITRASITKDFKELDERAEQTVVLVTHDVREAFYLGDAVCLMDSGKIVQQGTAHDLLFRPVNEFVKSFFDKDRLQLELSVVTMNSLRPFMNGSMVHFSKEESVWDALQGTNGKVDGMAGALMQAFNNYKQSLQR